MSSSPANQTRLVRPDNPDLVVVEASAKDHQKGFLRFRSISCQCALGRGGILDAPAKREGDGRTPAGLFHFDKLFYRPDRISRPHTELPKQAIADDLGWCDDPENAAYNQAVALPFPASTERLWRDDDQYDLLLTISHNRVPARPDRGSAIFLHIARSGLTPTRGCIALHKTHLLAVAAGLGPASMIRIEQLPLAER